MLARLRQGSRAWHRLALLLVVAVLAARLLVPSGWMLEGARLVPCDGMRAVARTGPLPDAAIQEAMMPDAAMHGAMAHGDHGKPGHASGAPEHPCAFAGLAQLATDPPPPAAPLLPVAERAPTRRAPEAPIPGRGLAAPPPLSTGPPRAA